jgi:hypothetical protein
MGLQEQDGFGRGVPDRMEGRPGSICDFGLSKIRGCRIAKLMRGKWSILTAQKASHRDYNHAAAGARLLANLSNPE